MAVEESLDSINAKLAKTLGLIKEITEAAGSAASAVNNVGGVGTSGKITTANGRGVAEAKHGGVFGIVSSAKNMFSGSTAKFTNSATGTSHDVAPTGGGGGSQASGLGGAGFSNSSNGASNMLTGALGAFGSLANGVYQATPGLSESAAYMGTSFMPTFAMQGPFNTRNFTNRTLGAVGQFASGQYDAQAAANMATMSGMGFSNNGNLNKMLGASGFAFAMTGMSNVTAVQGMVAANRGGNSASNRLMRAGISTYGKGGKQRDLGAIWDDLWGRWYGSKTAKVPLEKFESDLAGGYVGADLDALYGDNQAMYQMAVSYYYTKVKSGGKALNVSQLGGSGSAMGAAQGMGLAAENTPTIGAGRVNTARSAAIGATAVNGGMSGYNASASVISGFNSALSDANTQLGMFTQLLGVFNAGKGAVQGIGGSEVGQLVSGILGTASSIASMFAGGGAIRGGGGSTSDSIAARLSKGEFVINARAAQAIGMDNLNALNSSGKAFGSGFASPAKNFASGGEVVSYATQDSFLKTPYVDHTTISNSGPGNGWDCSSFTSYVYKNFGYNLPPYSDSQYKMGTPVSRGDLQSGDLMFFHYPKTSGNKTTGHVGIYMGDNKIVNAANSKAGTAIQGVDWDHFVGARRIIGSADVGAATPSADLGASVTADTGSDYVGDSALYSADNSKLYKQDNSSLYRSRSSASVKSLSSPGNSNSIGGARKISVRSMSVDANDMSPSDFAINVLRGLGAPTSGPAMEAMSHWVALEGGHWNNSALHNPLNTHQNYAGATNALSSGVKAYRTWQDGVNATLNNLAGVGGTYAPVVDAFKKNSSVGDIYRAIDASPWGTHNFSKSDLTHASGGLDTLSKDGLTNTHRGEMIFPAEPAHEFRTQLREFLNHTRSSNTPVNVTLRIDKASDEEAERFAHKVIDLIENRNRMSRLRTR